MFIYVLTQQPNVQLQRQHKCKKKTEKSGQDKEIVQGKTEGKR
jgi:hypothetical protein